MRMNGHCWKELENLSRIDRMITHCLECDTYFRVSIEQLKAANGQVKCGCCMMVFNAIESLLESGESQPHKNSIEQVQAGNEKTTNSALPDTVKIEDTEEKSTEALDQEELGKPNDTAHKKTTPHPLDLEAIETVGETFFEDDIDTLPGGKITIEDYDHTLFEETIQEEIIREPHNYSGVIWLIASLSMLTLLLFQIINFNPETMLAKYPQLQPLCRFIDCPVETEFNDLSKINLVSRDVREHLQFKDVLLVNATLVNSAIENQPFPKLQLDLFDKVGRPIGSRQFTPNEYLDSSVDIHSGMKPKLPVHIVLEVISPDEETSSFEFKFL